MKGIAIGKTIALVIAVIVIAIAIYFLVFVQLFDPWFLNPAKYKLVRYATCSLALCSNGFPSAQVDKVGCLEYEGGRCAKTCRTVVDEFIANKNEPTYTDLFGLQHFCKENNAIEFSFEPTFPIDIRSGEIQKISKPRWACRGASILDVTFHFSEGVESYLGECIMYGELEGSPDFDLTKIAGIRQDLEKAKGADASCYRGFESVIFTPLMPYSETVENRILPDERVFYSTALYLTDQFTSSSNPECQVSSNGPKLVGHGDPKTFDTISDCKIKVSDAKGRKKFKVWSDTLWPNTHEDLGLLGLLAGRPREGATCAYSILDRELIESPFQKGTKLSSSLEQIYPSLVEYKGELYLYFQDADSFYQESMLFKQAGIQSAIRLTKLDKEGSFSSSKTESVNIPIPYGDPADYRFIQPSVTVFNGHRYLAYSSNFPDAFTFVIWIKNLDNNYQEQVTEPSFGQFAPSITSFGENLYLFYHQELKGISEIYYKIGTVSDSSVKWSESNLLCVECSFPSATPTPDGLMVAYYFKTQQGSGIKVAILKNDVWQDAGTIVESGFINEFPEIVASNDEVVVFFDQGFGEFNKDKPTEFSRKIVYSRYLGNSKWPIPTAVNFVSAKKEMMPSAVAVDGKIYLAYSEFDVNFELKVTSAIGDLSGIPSDVGQADQAQQTETLKSITVRSDKDNYNKGETFKFIGNLEMESGSPEGKAIELELRQKFETIGDLLLDSEDVVADKDGNFVWEVALPSYISSGTYEVTASYRDKESTYKFKVN